MPKSYSNDLRQKVLDLYKESGHKSKTYSIFNIGRMTLDRWIELERVQSHVNRHHPEKEFSLQTSMQNKSSCLSMVAPSIRR